MNYALKRFYLISGNSLAKLTKVNKGGNCVYNFDLLDLVISDEVKVWDSKRSIFNSPSESLDSLTGNEYSFIISCNISDEKEILRDEMCVRVFNTLDELESYISDNLHECCSLYILKLIEGKMINLGGISKRSDFKLALTTNYDVIGRMELFSNSFAHKLFSSIKSHMSRYAIS